MNYVALLIKYVDSAIGGQAPENVALMFDEWSNGGMHCVSFFSRTNEKLRTDTHVHV